MSDNTEDPEDIGPTLLLKLPFFFLGVAIGMGIVWVAFQWVPGMLNQAASAISG